MRVIAIKEGYDGLQVRRPDAFEDGKPVVFEMPDGADQAEGAWFVAVDENGDPLKVLPKEPKKTGRESIPGQGPARGSQSKAVDRSNAAAVAAGLAAQPALA